MYNGRRDSQGLNQETIQKFMPVAKHFSQLRARQEAQKGSRYAKIYVKNWDYLQDELKKIAGKEVTVPMIKVKTGDQFNKKVKVPKNIVCAGLAMYVQLLMYQQEKAPETSYHSCTECACFWSDKRIREVMGITNVNQFIKIMDSLIYVGAIVRKVGCYNGNFANYYFVNPMLTVKHNHISEQF